MPKTGRQSYFLSAMRLGNTHWASAPDPAFLIWIKTAVVFPA
jgi:hypothetical protein